jgi:ABC-type bacteriocin/lantibiotic exporter with double-glycine peptidase domain
MPVESLTKVLYPAGDANQKDKPTSPYYRLWRMIVEDKQDLFLILIYSSLGGVMSLAVPLSTQMVVNTIAAGFFLQPITVIAGLVLGGLLFAAILRLLTIWLVELVRQRVFNRIALRIAYRVPRIQHSRLSKEYLPDLVNRFFDVITVQGNFANLLLDVPAATLQIVIGLTLMALYSPILLAFVLIVIAFVFCEVFLLGFGGYQTRSNETSKRYLVAEWLEELGRCETSIKLNKFPRHILEQTDNLVVEYTGARRKHFGVLFRQASGLAFFQAFAAAGVLGIGGWLVIERQLALGQLVAAQLLVTQMLPALERLIRHLQTLYELLSALGKIGYVEDLPLERIDGSDCAVTAGGATINIQGLHVDYGQRTNVINGMNLKLQPGERISLMGPNASGKSTLAFVLSGLIEPNSGIVQINGMDVRDINYESLRSIVSLVTDANEIFEGTIETNVTFGRSEISHADMQWALRLVDFDEELVAMRDGLKTQLLSGGRNLSRGQAQKLLIARAIAQKPQLLILDEAFTGIEERSKMQILDRLFAQEMPWTIIDISQDADTIFHASRMVFLREGKVVESGSLRELLAKKDSQLEHLFPKLVELIRK